MESQRFDQLSTAFASRFSRRNPLKFSGLGLGAAALGGVAMHRSAAAQDASPDASAQEHLGLPEGQRTYTMFVQTAKGGTWAPKDGEEGVYTLTLTGLPAQTVYFSDRPERIVGTQTTSEFLQALGFVPDNPPNAALVTNTDEGEDILVIELFNPVYTNEGEAGATLAYDARILENYHETELGGVAELQAAPDAMPATFDSASLFIDDCIDQKVICLREGKEIARVAVGCCYKFPSCKLCWDITHVCTTVVGCEDGGCGQENYATCIFVS